MEVSEGDASDGAVVEEDVLDGAVVEEDAREGAVVEGDARNGAVVEGGVLFAAVVEGDASDGAIVEGDASDGAVVDRDASDGAIVEGDVLDGPDDERKPQANAVKSEFKGKRATKKFSRYGKRGGVQKRNPLDRRSVSPGPTPAEPRRAPASGRKITKTEIIKQFGYVTRQCRKAQSEIDAALKDNHRLKRKASKVNQVVDELRTNLKFARIDVRHCKSVITEAAHNHMSSTNATEKKHKHMLNIMRNDANETMKASNALHASQLESKDDEIMASNALHASQMESKDDEIMVSQSWVVIDTVEHTVII